MVDFSMASLLHRLSFARDSSCRPVSPASFGLLLREIRSRFLAALDLLLPSRKGQHLARRAAPFHVTWAVIPASLLRPCSPTTPPESAHEQIMWEEGEGCRREGGGSGFHGLFLTRFSSLSSTHLEMPRTSSKLVLNSRMYHLLPHWLLEIHPDDADFPVRSAQFAYSASALPPLDLHLHCAGICDG